MKKKALVAIFVAVVVLGGFIAWGVSQNKGSDTYDAFATCIKDSGVKFYGAWWCPHCADQKKMFGASAKLLPYVECSTTDGNDQLKVCVDKKIEGYPTWIYPDGLAFSSTAQPEACDIRGTAGLSTRCQGVASEFLQSWIFPDVVIQSDTAPTVEGDHYAFGPDARAGVTSLERLSEITSCPLPETI